MPAPDVTALLHAWNAGDLDAREQVMMLVYEELRRRAAAHMRRERQGHLLQPTALVHEAYLRLVDQRHTAWRGRVQFLAVAAEIMRRVNQPGLDTGPSFFENDDLGRPQLFFGSNRGIAGVHDIYVSEMLPDGSFGPPGPRT